MNYAEAFRQLGDELDSPRKDWSAGKQRGIVLTLWTAEMISGDGKRFVDTRLSPSDVEVWGNKPGNKKRVGHPNRAVDEFDRWVDAILVSGTPRQSYGDAHPWDVLQSKARWRVTYFDREKGDFAAEPVPLTGGSS